MTTALIVHGHFYQPPRENPWTGEVEPESGAAPFHDWNDRIFNECYRANVYARVIDDTGQVERIVNNYQYISFNFGPTLMNWLERHHPISYGRILAADRVSAERRGGHGNAIAQAYNHCILPLCNERDRITQVRWGLADFRYRFEREPESLWLPETGCNDDTLGTLIDEKLKYVVLSPYQAARVRKIGEEDWKDVSDGSVDPGIPYRYFHKDGSGRYIDIFFYDGPLSRSIAFEGSLNSSRAFVDNFLSVRGGSDRVVTAATDGESYGHHTHFGDRCLAHAMEVVAPESGFRVTNFGEFLAENTPKHEAEIQHGPDGYGSAWSCAHGVGRWFRNCGCQTGARKGWNQNWRKPLREALEFLRDRAIEIFEGEGSQLFEDPWTARDAYIEALLDPDKRDEFLHEHAKRKLSPEDRVRALSFLEMQHNAMLMFTSCGWFFSDLSGIETIQILKYAGRVLDYIKELGLPSPRDQFLEKLAEAKSNKTALGNGADLFRRSVAPVRVSPRRVAAHITMSSLVDQCEEIGEIAGYDYTRESLQKRQHGRITLCTAKVTLKSMTTERSYESAVSAMHFGGVDFYSVVRTYPGDDAFTESAQILWDKFRTASLPSLLRVASVEFGPKEFGIEHLLPDAREYVFQTVFGSLVHRFSEQYANLYEDSRRTLDMLHSAGFQVPKELRAAAEFTLSRMFDEEIRKQQESRDPNSYMRAIEIAEEVTSREYQIDRSASSRTFEHMITHSAHIAVANPNSDNLEGLISLIELTNRLQLNINVESAQETVYEAIRTRGTKFPREEMIRLASLLWISPKVLERSPREGQF